MNTLRVLFFSLLIMSLGACSSQQEEEKTTIMNPPAEGFNLAESDEKAIQIADRVMEAMGGRKNWDDTRFIQWTFFGRRDLYWDKKEGRVRIEIPEKEMVMLVNVFDNTGKIQVAGEELTEPDSITKYVQQAKSIWINDSYWLVMPFKLKDSGVTLKYLREDTTTVGQLADVLELTFTGVGDTPENKYEVFVDKESNLVTQWDFYRTVKDTKAQFKTPWANYKTYGKVKLSGNRGNYHLNNIAVLETMDDAVFTDFAPLTP